MHKQLVVKSVKGKRKCFCYEPVSCACGCFCVAFLLSPKFYQMKNRGRRLKRRLRGSFGMRQKKPSQRVHSDERRQDKTRLRFAGAL